jgi:hypothetical protein
MNYTSVTNPVYASADKSKINCMVQFAAFSSPVPFCAMASDSTAHGPQIYADLIAGKYGPIGPYVAPVQPVPPTPSQQYFAAIAKGLAITSTVVPALSGTYGVAPADAANIAAEAQFIGTYNEFTNGQQTFDWPDAGGALHTFPSTATFMSFAKAAAQYVSGCKQTLNTLLAGGNASFPSNGVTI